MFEENENPVIEEITENVEQPTEEVVEEVQEEPSIEQPQVETFTKEQVDEMLAKKIARKEAKIRKEYDKKYGRLENVLKAGTGEEDVETIADTLTSFYAKKGIDIPKEPQYSRDYIEYRAREEANTIIEAGYDEIKEEVDRLANIGLDNMSEEDKIIFNKLAGERKRIEQEKDLATLGIGRDALNDEEFKQFSNKLNPSLSLKEKYEMYLQLKPKKQIDKMGSMKSGQTSKVKDFYTADEIERLTDEDLDNPLVWEAVRKSMTGQS